MLLTSMVFAQETKTAPELNPDAGGITLTPPSAGQADQAIIDATANNQFGIYLGKSAKAQTDTSGKNLTYSSIYTVNHSDWNEWQNYYTEKRVHSETYVYLGSTPVSHYSQAWFRYAGLDFGIVTDWQYGHTHAVTNWGYAGYTSCAGYGGF